MLLEEGGLWCVRGCRGGSETGECWFETIPVLAALCHGVNIKHKGSKVKHRQKASQRERGNASFYLSEPEWWFQRT